uniref:Uncharacterized protein n=1 Tax=Plectus sambesii TaxID=2011161 RepID=A0A914XN91_9BILA
MSDFHLRDWRSRESVLTDESERLLDHMNGESAAENDSYVVDIDSGSEEHVDAGGSEAMDDGAFSNHLAETQFAHCHPQLQPQRDRIMRYKYNVAFTTVQVEPFDVRYMTSCEQCVGPVS